MMKIPDTPRQFFDIIPVGLIDNIKFRVELNKMLSVDRVFQSVFMDMCRQFLPIFYNTVAWTLNPQKPPAERNQPFILRPAQIPAVETLDWCIQNKTDVGLNKSRKQGASEICCKLFAARALLDDYSHFIMGSRKKELVDCFGDNTTLFAKVDSVFKYLPSWWLKLSGYDPTVNRKDMVLTVPATESGIVGETTNESFSAGSRGTALLLDEFGRVPKDVADSIEGSVHDVADTIIYSSTHWFGAGHTFANCLAKPSTKVISLLWSDNPEENYGLYRTPEPGKVQIVDIAYYRSKCPDVFNNIEAEQVVELETIQARLLGNVVFVADGLKGIPSPYRAPWFDREERKRKGNRRDFVCNVCATPLGASDVPFDPMMLKTIKEKYIRYPDVEGELSFQLTVGGAVDPESPIFAYQNQGRLKWWGDLPFGRPDQQHNYVIGCDPSYGLGSANSAACVYDVNTHEQVGSWIDSTTKPEDFADMMVALAYWIGGVSIPFLIWESNAGCGQGFGKRVIFNGYHNVYTQRVEDAKTRKKTRKWGWRSNAKVKEMLLGDLGVALSNGLEGDDTYLTLIVHEEELVNELADCVFKERGSGIVAASKADLSTGAMERHGDRAIAAGLCILGTKEQEKGDVKQITTPRFGTFRYYQLEEEKKQKRQKRESRRFLY